MEPRTSVESGAQQHTISCTECQRRKQKCSRQWPCNHCQSRKVPHMCHFASKKASISSESKTSAISSAKKRKGPEQEIFASESTARSEEEYSAADALKALGYLKVDGDPQMYGMLSEYRDSRLDRENEIATKEVPPRIYCDAIVQNYMDVCNYWYYPIYPPQFLESYNTWWENRKTRQKNRPEFTCLILRVLSSSTQCVHPALRNRLEGELGETLQELTQKYHDAAERLSNMIKPGAGGVVQVQQLFLTAVWLKSECLFINAWHALGDAIRDAQEVGMHNESLWYGLSEFDCEIRRRVWTTLYIWDRFMGMMLSRPLHISEKDCFVKYPSVNLEYDDAYPDLLCPHKHMAVQQRLCQTLLEDLDGSKPSTPVNDALRLVGNVEQWLATLPPAFHPTNTDTRYDNSHRYIVLQRLQTIVMGNSAIVTVLKAFLTQTHQPEPQLDSNMLRRLQTIAVEKCIANMNIAQELADLYIPDYNKYFLIVFTPFDTAALLCSAIIHDVTHILPLRNEILRAIALGLGLLRRLAKVTKTGSVAESVIVSLMSKFDLTPEESSIFNTCDTSGQKGKRLATSATTSSISTTSSDGAGTPPVPDLSPDAGPVPTLSTESTATTLAPEMIDDGTGGAYSAPPPVEVYNQYSMEQMANFEFGPLEPVFDWSHVNLFKTEQPGFAFNGTL